LAPFAYFVGAITYTTPSVLAFDNIGWHLYLLYMALCLISTVIVYFFVPETKGLPVEEIGDLRE
jgi:Sugar (and other) transporter